MPLQSSSCSCSGPRYPYDPGLIINTHTGSISPKAANAAVLRAALQQVTHRNGALRQDAKTQKPTKCVLNELGSKTMHLEQTLLIQKGFKKCVEMPNLCGCFARKQMETQERKCQPA